MPTHNGKTYTLRKAAESGARLRGLPANLLTTYELVVDGKVVARAVGENSIPDLETEIGKLTAG